MNCADRSVFVMLCSICGFIIVGCDGPKNPIVPVQGTIKFTDGTPLPSGTRISFNCTDGSEIGTASAVTSDDGSFSVTHISGSTGAEVGKYEVSLIAPEGDSGDFYKIVPEKYNHGALSLEVTPDMQPVTLTVEKIKKK